MSEEYSGAVSGASAGSGIAFALGSVNPLFAIAGGVAGLLSGKSAKKKRRRAEQAQRVYDDKRLVTSAYEIGRVARIKAPASRGMYAAGGVSVRSGTAQSMERDTIREATYQQERVLAGLTGRTGHMSPLAALAGNRRAGWRMGSPEEDPYGYGRRRRIRTQGVSVGYS